MDEWMSGGLKERIGQTLLFQPSIQPSIHPLPARRESDKHGLLLRHRHRRVHGQAGHRRRGGAGRGQSSPALGRGLRSGRRGEPGRGPRRGGHRARPDPPLGLHRLRPRQRALGRRADDGNRLPRQGRLLPLPPANDRDRHRGTGQQGDPPRRDGPPHQFQDEPQVRGRHGRVPRRPRSSRRSARASGWRTL